MLDAAWIKPGAHLSAMGADSPGKQELPHALVSQARLFCDLRTQAFSIGELQSAFRDGVIDPTGVTEIGEVVNGSRPGRQSPSEITVFDSSGTAVQDLAICALAVRLARAAGDGEHLET